MPHQDTTHTPLAAAAPRPAAPAETPLILGRYRIVEQCGTGGFGRVLVCWDTRLQRRVAIKVIPLRIGMPAGSSAAATVKEALAEARTSSLLAHPNIVTVYDFESDGHYAYLVMEYVDGLNLSELLKRVEGGTLTYEECAHLLDSVASALDYAHENGVLHLDLKPSNIMIDRSGIVKLADFGMSTLASAAGYGGARGGTVGYMPPEQIQGMLVDERTDIFSLGTVLWQALCGACPFQAETPEDSLEKILQGAHFSLSQNHLELDQNIELVLERCLEPDAQNRMSSAEKLAKRLVPLLGEPHEGQASLKELVQQSDEGAEDEESWTERYIEKTPVADRFPWLPGAALRTVTAVATAATLWKIVPRIAPGTPEALAVCAAGGAAAAIWTPLGSLVVLAAFIGAYILSGVNQLSISIIAIAGVAGALWWRAVGFREKLGSASLLFAASLGFPEGSAGLAGFGLPPLKAGATGFLSALACQLLAVSSASGFHARTAIDAFAQTYAAGHAWLMPIGCGLAALAASLVGGGRRGWRAWAGQALCCIVLIAFQALSRGVENSGIWTAAELQAAVLAIVLSVGMCFASALRGSTTYEPEG